MLSIPGRMAKLCDGYTRREFLRVRVTERGLLEAFAVQSSAVLTSVTWADGLAQIAEGRSVQRGAEVPYLPFSELFG